MLIHPSSPACATQAKRCLHTRRFGTLTSPPPPVILMPWGPHPPGHRSPLIYFWLLSGPALESLQVFPIPCPLMLLLRESSWLEAFVYQIVMLQWVVSFSCILVLMINSVKILPYAVLWIHWLLRYTQVLCFTLLNLPRVRTCWLFLLVLQGIAGATGVSNFLRAFLMVSLNSLSSGSMK